MTALTGLAGLTLIAVAGFAASAAAQGVLAEGAKWEKVSGAGKVFAEGVVAAPDGTLYLVDLAPPGTLFRHDPKSGETTVVASPSNMSNGLHIGRGGNLLICKSMPGGTGIAQRDLATGAETMLVSTYNGKKLIAPNDLTTDDRGRIYFTDARFNQAEEPELPNAVYRFDPDTKTLTQLTTDIGRPNGIEVSPDGTRLYVAVSIAARLRPNPLGPAADKFGITKGGVIVYDLAADGSIANGRVFYKTEVAMADGMAMDTDGNLYIAFHDNPNRLVIALDPNGKVIEEFPLPEGLTTQLGFGRGEDAGSLYLTTGAPWALHRIKTARKGFYRF